MKLKLHSVFITSVPELVYNVVSVLNSGGSAPMYVLVGQRLCFYKIGKISLKNRVFLMWIRTLSRVVLT